MKFQTHLNLPFLSSNGQQMHGKELKTHFGLDWRDYAVRYIATNHTSHYTGQNDLIETYQNHSKPYSLRLKQSTSQTRPTAGDEKDVYLSFYDGCPRLPNTPNGSDDFWTLATVPTCSDIFQSLLSSYHELQLLDKLVELDIFVH